MSDNSKIFMAALGGAVIGAGLALLLAPTSGKETRNKIAEKMNEAKDNLADKGKSALHKVKEKTVDRNKKAQNTSLT